MNFLKNCDSKVCFDRNTQMDCFKSEEAKAQIKRHKMLEKQMKAYKEEYNKEIKLLLLGTGEAGKSTFVRQMRILYTTGYTEDDRRDQIKLIHQNIFNSMQSLITAMKLLEIDYEKEENFISNATLIMYVQCEHATYLEDPYLSAIKELWNDAGIQKCYRRRREYQLNDSTKYYLTNIDRIAQTDYIPTDQDILRVRIATTGLVEHVFEIKNVVFRMTDVGGQRSERRKWMHCFDNVRSIIFLLAISEYDQVLMESAKRNRLRESKTVFEAISEWFNDTPIILFLNKTDLLDEKIMYSDLGDYFPEFTGPRHSADAAREFFLNMFLQTRPQRNLYIQFTCATDTENIQVVFSAVRNMILNYHLDGLGLL